MSSLSPSFFLLLLLIVSFDVFCYCVCVPFRIIMSFLSGFFFLLSLLFSLYFVFIFSSIVSSILFSAGCFHPPPPHPHPHIPFLLFSSSFSSLSFSPTPSPRPLSCNRFLINLLCLSEVNSEYANDHCLNYLILEDHLPFGRIIFIYNSYRLLQLTSLYHCYIYL